MADIAVATAGQIHVVESIEQHTLPAAEAIVAGAPVYIIPSSTGAGSFANADATTSAGIFAAYGIATRSVAEGEAVTAIRKGVLDGFTLSGDYWLPIYLSENVGRLADAGPSGSGTAVIMGRILPIAGETLGTAPSKVLLVDVP